MRTFIKLVICLFIISGSQQVYAQHINEKELEELKNQLDMMLEDDSFQQMDLFGELNKLMSDSVMMQNLMQPFNFKDTSMVLSFENMDDLMKEFDAISQSFMADTTLQNELFKMFESQGFDDFFMPLQPPMDSTENKTKTYSF